jgi:hypothetical protein
VGLLFILSYMNFLKMPLGAKGVSYIQILLASSVIAGLAVVGLKMMKNQEKLARMTAQKFEVNYLIGEMFHILKDPQNCKASLSGMLAEKSVRKINALKKELRGGDHKEATYYLKYFTFDSSKKLYAQNSLKILSYELSDSSPSVDSKRGSTHLVVKLQNNEEENPSNLVRTIPIRFRASGGMISNCEAFNNLVDSSNVSFGGSMNLGKALHVGPRRAGVELSVDGGMSLEIVKADFPHCSLANTGQLIYMKKYDEVFFCTRKSGWSSLGLFPNQTKGIVYRIDARREPSYVVETQKHRVCILKGFKSNEKGTCKLTAQVAGEATKWRLAATYTSPRGGQYCEAECFN